MFADMQSSMFLSDSQATKCYMQLASYPPQNCNHGMLLPTSPETPSNKHLKIIPTRHLYQESYYSALASSVFSMLSFCARFGF